MVSKYATGAKSESLLAGDEIRILAKEILLREHYDEAEELARMLVSTRSQVKLARSRLMHLIEPPPKRPLYYCQDEIGRLPTWTRDAVRYLGDFIDLLLKEALYESNGDERVFNSPMGPTIDRLSKLRGPFSAQLITWLRTFNQFVYRPAKHDFKLPKGRTEHRFTSREVVLTAFVSMSIAERITRISKRAQMVRLDKIKESHYTWQT